MAISKRLPVIVFSALLLAGTSTGNAGSRGTRKPWPQIQLPPVTDDSDAYALFNHNQIISGEVDDVANIRDPNSDPTKGEVDPPSTWNPMGKRGREPGKKLTFSDFYVSRGKKLNPNLFYVSRGKKATAARLLDRDAFDEDGSNPFAATGTYSWRNEKSAMEPVDDDILGSNQEPEMDRQKSRLLETIASLERTRNGMLDGTPSPSGKRRRIPDSMPSAVDVA